MRSRLGFRAIALCLTLASLTAVGAGSAQAETGAYWLVSGKKFTTLLPELNGTLVLKHNMLLGTIGGVGIAILCEEIVYSQYHLLEPNGGELGSKRYKKCGVLRLILGVFQKLPACNPSGGEFTTTTLKGLIVLSGGTPVRRLEPNSGTLIASFATSEECAFGEKIEVSGKMGFQDAAAAFSTNQVTHTFTEHPATTELYFNNNKANKVTLDGSEAVTLTGASHTGLTWSGTPA